MSTYIILAILAIVLASCDPVKEQTTYPGQTEKIPDTIRIMTYNMWHGGDAGKQPGSKTIEVIRRAGAGIVGAQETHGYGDPRPDNSAQMAGNMGWRHVDQGGFDAVMTKYTIEGTPTDKRALKIKIDENRYVWMVNTHLNYIPYQPYQLNDKEYGDYPFISTEEEAVYWANQSRKAEVDSLVALVKSLDDGWPVIVTGDFNEPSYLDWTDGAAAAGINAIKVTWPSTRAFADAGFRDAYREDHPDEVAFPGETWTSIRSPGEVHDRIDFILYRGDRLRLIKTEVVGETAGKSDIVVSDYPSDHRAVVATFVWVE